MELAPLQCHVKASDLPVERLAGNKQLTETEKVTEISRQFEAVLLRQLAAHARFSRPPRKPSSPPS